MPSEIEITLSRLQGVKKISGGYQATCPCHDDRHQSLSVKDDNGKLLLYCHAGCSFENIVKALDLRPDRTNDTPVITDTYDYTDADGNLLYQVVRYHPKAFKQRRPGMTVTWDGNQYNSDWIWDLKGITPLLYRLPEVIQAIEDGKMIFIVEGEKDADNLRKNGQVATTISGGASTKWHPSLVPLFEGARVVIIPDNDDAGRKYANYVANLLYGWCSSLKLVILPSCKDVSDFLATQESVMVTAMDRVNYNVQETSEYTPVGAITRDEFNSFRGINLYLWQQLKRRKPKRQSKYS